MTAQELKDLLTKYMLYLLILSTISVALTSILYVHRKTAYIDFISNELLRDYPCSPVTKESK
jgi:hypothetical protein